MNPNDPPNLYNIVTIKNIDNEDFIFSVNKEEYLIKAGETRNFPKFMVNIGLKHLIDKILLKRDPEGKLVRRVDLRDELASQIIIEEVSYEKPQAPTDEELVQQVNRPTDLERLLQKNKQSLRDESLKDNLKKTDTIIPPPIISQPELDIDSVKGSPTNFDSVPPPTILKIGDQEIQVQSQETFQQLEEEKAQPMPTKAKMLDYAKNTLKMEINDPKQKLDKMTAPKLFKTLGLDKEEDLKELGLYA